jgi:hypothetical protein
MSHPILRSLISEMIESYLEGYIPVPKPTNRVNDPKSAAAHKKLTKDMVELAGPDRKIRSDNSHEVSWHAHNFEAKSREEHEKIRDHLRDKGWKLTGRSREHDHDWSVGSMEHTSPDGKHQVITKFNDRPERPGETYGNVTFRTKKYKLKK